MPTRAGEPLVNLRASGVALWALGVIGLPHAGLRKSCSSYDLDQVDANFAAVNLLRMFCEGSCWEDGVLAGCGWGGMGVADVEAGGY